MKNNRPRNVKKLDLKGIALWRDHYDHFTDEQPETDEGHDILEGWLASDLHWAHVGAHPFRIGDRIILFEHEAIPITLPCAVDPIEVVDIARSKTNEKKSNLTHFIAYRRLEGFRPVALSPDPVEELRSRGIIKNMADLQHRKRLCSEEWDQIVEVFELRQKQVEAEKQPKGKAS